MMPRQGGGNTIASNGNSSPRPAVCEFDFSLTQATHNIYGVLFAVIPRDRHGLRVAAHMILDVIDAARSRRRFRYDVRCRIWIVFNRQIALLRGNRYRVDITGVVKTGSEPAMMSYPS